jgi:surface polysaccharide O-acyltransferase-like enzyme
MSGQLARNIGILVLLALVVAFAPAGGEGADLVRKILNAAFIVVMALIIGTLYRQYRGEIFGLGDQWRFALYAAVGLAILTVSITGRMWGTGAGAFVWVAVIGACSYTLYVIWQRYRSYT